MRAQFQALGERLFLKAGGQYELPENAVITLLDLTPGTLAWRPLGAPSWREVRVGRRVEHLLEMLGLQSLAGRYELRVPTGAGTLELLLTLRHAHLSPHDVQAMLDVLGSVDYGWDAVNGVTGLVAGLGNDVRQFVTLWTQLHSAVQVILREPAQQLDAAVREVQPHEPYRMGAGLLGRNVREGRLSPQGQLLRDRLWGQVPQITLDLPENAYVTQVCRRFVEVTRDLQGVVRSELAHLETRLEQERAYGARDFGVLQAARQDAARAAQELETLNGASLLPGSWWTWHSPPDASSNRVRFDPRYAQVARLDGELGRLRADRGRWGRRAALEECGRRRSWSLYEYWMVAKVYRALLELRFRPAAGEGFHTLEDHRGRPYGLRNRASLELRHTEAPELSVILTYQKKFLHPTRNIIPDLTLELRAPAGTAAPQILTLDAKYKKYRAGHPDLERDRSLAVRHYRQVTGGMAFLAHLGDTEAWPACSDSGEVAMLGVEDLNYAGGIVRLTPQEDRGIRRVLTAWLFRQGVLRVCYRCGHHLGGDAPEQVRLPVRQRQMRQRYPEGYYPVPNWAVPFGERTGERRQLAYRCRVCRTANTVTGCRCGTPVLKFYPGDRGEAFITPEWLGHVEIAHRTAGSVTVRHCPRCAWFPRGSTLEPPGTPASRRTP